MAENREVAESATQSEPERKYTPFETKRIEGREIYWEDWLAKWEELKTAQEMVGWLHFVFDTASKANSHAERVPVYRERILFCLDVASSYWKWQSWAISNGVDVRSYSICQASGVSVAMKAMSLLVKNFFTIGNKGNLEQWIEGWNGSLVLSPEVLPKVLALFKRDGDRYRIPELLKEHEQRVVKEFLLTIAKLGWCGHNTGLSEDQLKLVQELTPELLRILIDFHELGYLLERKSLVTKNDLKLLRDIIFKPAYVGAEVPPSIGAALASYQGGGIVEVFLILDTYHKYVSSVRNRIERATRERDHLVTEKEARTQRIRELQGEVLKEKDIDRVCELKAEYDSLTDTIPALEAQIVTARGAVEKLRNRRF